MTIELLIGKFHPVFVHFPIVLAFLLFICDLMVLFGKYEYERFGDFVLLLTLLFFIPTLTTGFMTSYAFSEEDIYLHQWLAVTSFLFALFLAFWRFYLSKKHLHKKMRLNFLFSLILIVLIAITGDLGGIITHGISPFINLFKPSED